MSFFTEHQRKRILDKVKAQRGEVMAEFDNEMLKIQIKENAELREQISRLQAEVEKLKNLIKALMEFNSGDKSTVELWELVSILSKWANGDE